MESFIKTNIKKGSVRMIMFTDAQFKRMKMVIGEVQEREAIEEKNLFDF